MVNDSRNPEQHCIPREISHLSLFGLGFGLIKLYFQELPLRLSFLNSRVFTSGNLETVASITLPPKQCSPIVGRPLRVPDSGVER